MGLEYFPMIGCPIQAAEDIDAARFIVLGKIGAMVAELRLRADEFADPAKGPFEDQPVGIPCSLETLEAGKPTEVRVGDLYDFWDGIAEQANPVCSGCPLNHKRSPLGCYAAITYPITEAGERWLMERFDPPNGEFGYLPSHIQEFKVDGKRLDAGRPEGILAGAEPARKRLSTGGEYTSSQIFEFLFGCEPNLIPQTLFALCSSFGALEVDPAEAQMIDLQLGLAHLFGQDKVGELSLPDWKRELGEKIPFILRAEPGEDRSVYKFKQFLYACWTTFCADGELVIDG